MRDLQAEVDYQSAHMEWMAFCESCRWIETYTLSGEACDAADWHDVEVHRVLG